MVVAAGLTVTVLEDVPENPLASVAVRVNVKLVLFVTDGAVKVALAELAPVNDIAGEPPV